MVDTSFTGPVNIEEGFSVSGAVNLQGPLKTGLSALQTIGVVPAQKRISVSADGPSAPVFLPNCHISRIWVNTEVAWEASAGCTTTIRAGTSADATFYGSVVVSGVGTREFNVSGGALLSVAASSHFTVDVTTVGTAGVGQGSVYVQYHQIS